MKNLTMEAESWFLVAYSWVVREMWYNVFQWNLTKCCQIHEHKYLHKHHLFYNQWQVASLPEDMLSPLLLRNQQMWLRHYKSLPSCGDLSCHRGQHQDDCNFRLFVILHDTKSAFRAVQYKRVPTTTQVAYWGPFRMQFFYITWLTYRPHRRGGHCTTFLTSVTYGSQSNSKLNS